MSYIDVEKALESINLIAEKDGKSFDKDSARYAIQTTEPADVVEVVHGEWTNIRDYGDYCLGHCSVCRTPQEVAFPSALKEGFRYCRWCGAKMDGKGD